MSAYKHGDPSLDAAAYEDDMQAMHDIAEKLSFDKHEEWLEDCSDLEQFGMYWPEGIYKPGVSIMDIIIDGEFDFIDQWLQENFRFTLTDEKEQAAEYRRMKAEFINKAKELIEPKE